MLCLCDIHIIMLIFLTANLISQDILNNNIVFYVLKNNAITYTTFPKFTFYLQFTCFYLLHIMSYFICVYSSLCGG